MALGLFTLDKILKLIFKALLLLPIDLRVFLLPLIKSLNILIKKKPHYIIVFTEEAGLKKKINSNIEE